MPHWNPESISLLSDCPGSALERFSYYVDTRLKEFNQINRAVLSPGVGTKAQRSLRAK